ncbi:MAG: CDGSH iron-sulfur domain-containing protein [Turneriella sp.]
MQGKIAGNAPMEITLEAGKTYYWCACGHSKTQPFCDGTHNEVNFSLTDALASGKYKPVRVKADEDKKAWFCLCKQTKTPPFCDSSHKKI